MPVGWPWLRFLSDRHHVWLLSSVSPCHPVPPSQCEFNLWIHELGHYQSTHSISQIVIRSLGKIKPFIKFPRSWDIGSTTLADHSLAAMAGLTISSRIEPKSNVRASISMWMTLSIPKKHQRVLGISVHFSETNLVGIFDVMRCAAQVLRKGCTWNTPRVTMLLLIAPSTAPEAEKTSCKTHDKILLHLLRRLPVTWATHFTTPVLRIFFCRGFSCATIIVGFPLLWTTCLTIVYHMSIENNHINHINHH